MSSTGHGTMSELGNYHQSLGGSHTEWSRLAVAHTYEIERLRGRLAVNALGANHRHATRKVEHGLRALTRARDIVSGWKRAIQHSGNSLYSKEQMDAYLQECDIRGLYRARDSTNYILPSHMEKKGGTFPHEMTIPAASRVLPEADSHKCTLYDLRVGQTFDCDHPACPVAGSSNLQSHFAEPKQWRCGRCFDRYQTLQGLRDHLGEQCGMRYDCPRPGCLGSHDDLNSAEAHHRWHEENPLLTQQPEPLEHECIIKAFTASKSPTYICTCNSHQKMTARVMSLHLAQSQGAFRCGYTFDPSVSGGAAMPCQARYFKFDDLKTHVHNMHEAGRNIRSLSSREEHTNSSTGPGSTSQSGARVMSIHPAKNPDEEGWIVETAKSFAQRASANSPAVPGPSSQASSRASSRDSSRAPATTSHHISGASDGTCNPSTARHLEANKADPRGIDSSGHLPVTDHTHTSHLRRDQGMWQHFSALHIVHATEPPITDSHGQAIDQVTPPSDDEQERISKLGPHFCIVSELGQEMLDCNNIRHGKMDSRDMDHHLLNGVFACGVKMTSANGNQVMCLEGFGTRVKVTKHIAQVHHIRIPCSVQGCDATFNSTKTRDSHVLDTHRSEWKGNPARKGRPEKSREKKE